jgi:RNA methyltransferase, TrmH family
MLSHNQIKYINSLKIKKFRQQHGTFIVEGEKGVSELLLSSLKPVKIFALSEWLDRNLSLLRSLDIELQEITADELKKVSDLLTPNKVLAIAEIPETATLEPFGFTGMTLALDGIRDPGNMGTMIRTADWFGIKRIICSSDSVDVYNPKVVQATMGSFSRVTVFYTDLIDFFKALPKDVLVYGALLEGPDLTKKTFTKEGIILIGSESHGISRELIQYVNEPLHIPRFLQSNADNQAESLNASIANGIICYEICKQLSKNNF